MGDEQRIDLEGLRALFQLLNEFDIGEFEYRLGELSVRVVHRGSGTSRVGQNELFANLIGEILQQKAGATGANQPVQNTPSLSSAKNEPIVKPAVEQPTKESDTVEGLHIIKSPIVGTFYRAPAPDAAPFVEIGDEVKPGQTVCIVEAMKIMNEIQTDVAGEVVAIYVANGAPVEYGQKLIAIRPVEPS